MAMTSPTDPSALPPGTLMGPWRVVAWQGHGTSGGVYLQWRYRRQAAARYEATPADDVYALGVTAYRLVVGSYPLTETPPEEDEALAVDDTHLRIPTLVAPEVQVSLHPELARLIRQTLSDEPSERGSAQEVALALENAARRAGREADEPITPRTARTAAVPEARPVPAYLLAPWHRWLAAVVVIGMTLTAGFWAGLSQRPVEATSAGMKKEGPQARTGVEDEEITGLADAGLKEVGSRAKPGSARGGLSHDMPKKPLPGQRRPPCEGHEIEINGGCWGMGNATPPCGVRAYEWKNRCYWPSMDSPRPPTSDQP